MRWADAQRDTLIGGDWGKAPSLVEVIPARITRPFAPGRAKAWALDERGQRGDEVRIGPGGNNNAIIEIGTPAHTLWYEVDVAETPAAAGNP